MHEPLIRVDIPPSARVEKVEVFAAPLHVRLSMRRHDAREVVYTVTPTPPLERVTHATRAALAELIGYDPEALAYRSPALAELHRLVAFLDRILTPPELPPPTLRQYADDEPIDARTAGERARDEDVERARAVIAASLASLVDGDPLKLTHDTREVVAGAIPVVREYASEGGPRGMGLGDHEAGELQRVVDFLDAVLPPPDPPHVASLGPTIGGGQ